MNFHINDHQLCLLIDGRQYNEKVLYKCFYWYSNNYSVDIDIETGPFYKITLQATKESDSLSWNHLIEKIKKDLIDFKLRDIISQETQTIRELIVAKAFAYYEIQETPQTNISDPVGFNPENVLEC
ncbi:His-Xaa-Ser system protein HxsD [Chitinophaga rupis]|uniref:His-Xaa-Ser system protein HxsD n=1 Tax=Chitinophaga rupis TaxID=573321 RepID=A0A1H8F0A0_9BACT|nr:His-Xaa-Ser system protein HxsD [Chitinophaga rupis]SEN24428.1 His-Xaa-Ser system protein HxsD [Chitinophaga rupis]